jgi:hypothetical protein
MLTVMVVVIVMITATIIIACFPPLRPGFHLKSGHVGFIDKMALRQVFSEYFGFPCQFSFHQLLHTL